MPIKPVVEWRHAHWRAVGYLLLWPAGVLFGAFLIVRDLLRKKVISDPQRDGLRRPFVIVVGSIAVGGSGKTPVVEFLAGELYRRHRRVCVLNHGYKKKRSGIVVAYDGKVMRSTVGDSGDESTMLGLRFAANALSIPVISAENRREAIEWIQTQFEPEVIILDDGLQDGSVKPDFSIGVMDQDELEYPQLPLPLGRLRDRPRKLRQCNVEVITKRSHSNANGDGSDVELVWTPTGLVNIATQTRSALDVLHDQRIMAFAGIGHFQPFRRLMQELAIQYEADSIRFREWPDHHHYKTSDLTRLIQKDDTTLLITTHKDAVKLADLQPWGGLHDKVLYLDIQIDGGSELVRAVENVLAHRDSAFFSRNS